MIIALFLYPRACRRPICLVCIAIILLRTIYVAIEETDRKNIGNAIANVVSESTDRDIILLLG